MRLDRLLDGPRWDRLKEILILVGRVVRTEIKPPKQQQRGAMTRNQISKVLPSHRTTAPGGVEGDNKRLQGGHG